MPQSSLPDTTLSLHRQTIFRESIRLFRSSSKDSLKSTKSAKSDKKRPSYHPYSVYDQTMFPLILRDPDATTKLLEAVLESPNGKRSLSRLARTCRALSEPALNILWRDLDSLVPIIGLFPGQLLKKARKPGLGLTKSPAEEDWKAIVNYGERVRRIAYHEAANNVAITFFSALEERRPNTYILPHLQELTWKIETPAALDRCRMFLNPGIQTINLEVENKMPQLDAFLTDMSSRTKLKGFSFNSSTNLPDAFTGLLAPQKGLEKVVLVAPGALSSGVGRWIASLPHLKCLQLDLTGRSPIAVEGFFDELRPRSGDSTPSSIGSTDSGIFSGDDLDFTEIRKSAMRLTGDLPSRGSFSQLRKLHLTGDVANVAVFLKHLDNNMITHLDIAIEDPPDNADWQDLSGLICDCFSDTLQTLRISATPSSKFTDLVRSTSRAEPPTRRLSLEQLMNLTNLVRLDIDLPESVVFTPIDIECLAKACPNLEILRLCPLARFPTPHLPKITLASLAPLTTYCKRLHTLAIVFDATPGSPTLLNSQKVCSPSLLRLHVGHSWAADPLQISILLSHLMPRLESLKWFQEKNRGGFIEAHAKSWQSVSETLPHLQLLRSTEKSFLDIPQLPEKFTSEKAISATVSFTTRSVDVRPHLVDASIQISPILVSREVNAVRATVSEFVDATTSNQEVGVQAVVILPSKVSTAVDAIVRPPLNGGVMFAPLSPECSPIRQPYPSLYFFSSLLGFFSFAYRLTTLPFSFTSRILHLALARLQFSSPKPDSRVEPPKLTTSSVESLNVTTESFDLDDIPLDTLPIPSHANTYAYDYDHAIHAIHFFSKAPVAFKYESAAARTDSEVNIVTWIGPQTNSNNSNIATRQRDWTQGTHNSKSASWIYIMSDNKKQEKDFTKEVDALLPEAAATVKAGKLQVGLDTIFALEKQTRNASDLASTSRLVKAAVQHCYDARDYPLLNSTVTLLSKKHGQLKAAVQAIVELTMSWLTEVKARDGVGRWLELVETLRGVTEGKIFLETPRARVTLLLSHYHEKLFKDTTSKESKESLQLASDLLSDLQVETYSSMERREKTEFILEQMRLLIAVARQKDAEVEKKDGKDSLGGGEAEWVKVRVGGRKVNEEFLKDKDNEDLKLKYYDLMVQHALQHASYLDVAKYYYKVWETPSIKEDVNGKGKAALEHIVYYIVLAPHNNEQSDMLHHLYADSALSNLALHYNLVKCFVTRELMRWPGIEAMYGTFLRKTPVFESNKRWEDLHTRVIEHNIRVVAQYYTRITLTRLTSLLDLTSKQTEEILARLVVSGTIWAKIDRPAGVVNFRSKRSAEDVMNDWSSDMQRLLGLVEKAWMGMNAAQAAQSRVKS